MFLLILSSSGLSRSPLNSHVEILTLSTSECGYLEKESLKRQLMLNEVLSVGLNP